MVTGARRVGTKVVPKGQVTGVGRWLWKEVVYHSPDLPSDSHQWCECCGWSLSLRTAFRGRHTAWRVLCFLRSRYLRFTPAQVLFDYADSPAVLGRMLRGGREPWRGIASSLRIVGAPLEA
jgi:hypothetical protein